MTQWAAEGSRGAYSILIKTASPPPSGSNVPVLLKVKRITKIQQNFTFVVFNLDNLDPYPGHGVKGAGGGDR